MLLLLQPLFVALVGAAMTVFGFLHTFQQFPRPEIWHRVLVVAPQLMSVLLFIACLALAGAGVAMFIAGIRSTRRRIDQVRHVPWDRVPGGNGRPHYASPYDDPEGDWR